MGYDYQLVGGFILAVLGIVAVANAMVEQRTPVFSLVAVIIGLVLVGWAWMLADQSLTMRSVPDAIIRLLAQWN